MRQPENKRADYSGKWGWRCRWLRIRQPENHFLGFQAALKLAVPNMFSGCLNGKAVSEHLCFLILANFCGLLPWLRHSLAYQAAPALFDTMLWLVDNFALRQNHFDT